jgi:hypothetical protein
MFVAGATSTGWAGGMFGDVSMRRFCVGAWPPADGGTVLAGATTGVAMGAFAWRFGVSWSWAVDVVFAAGLVALSDADQRYRRLPTVWCRVVAAVAVSMMVGAAAWGGGWPRTGATLAAGTFNWCVFAVVWWAVGAGRSRSSGRIGGFGRFGRGDVRLAWLAGVCAAWTGPPAAAVLLAATALLAGCGIGMVAGVGAARRARSARTVVPLGPPVSAATLATALWGPDVLRSLGLS